MNASELPDIPGINTEGESRLSEGYRKPTKVKTGYSIVSLVAIGFLSVVVATGSALAVTLIGKNELLVMLGAQAETKKEDAIAKAIQEQKSQLELLANSLDHANQSLADLQAYADARTIDMNKLTQRVFNVERFSSDLEKKIADQKKAQQFAVVQQKKAVAAKPKPVPIVPLTLVSIRTQAGTPLVALRDGLDKSELLMPGDTWRGWRFLDADSFLKSARFQVDGKVQELRL